MEKTDRSVVIASEDLVIINQISSILRRNEYSIIIQKSTPKAMLKIFEKEIQFLILDLNVSNDTNLDFIKIIKNIRPRLPIVVVTKDCSVDTMRKYIEAGIFYFLLKPMQISELEKVLQAIDRYYQK